VSPLTIVLEDGFDGDHVVVRTDGLVARDLPDVRTRTQISRAEEFTVEAPGGRVTIDVDVPDRATSSRVTVHTADAARVAFSIGSDGVLRHRVDREAWGDA
jgi:hypothetical protein